VFHNLADRRIDGNPAFGLQLAEWYMDDPLIRAERKQTIEGQIHALADTHTGVALEEQEITEEIVAALQFLLDELILFRQQWTRGVFIAARDIRPREEMSQGWDLFVPSEVLQHAVQKGDAEGNGDFGQWRSMGA
jgi:hypothetical protein